MMTTKRHDGFANVSERARAWSARLALSVRTFLSRLGIGTGNCEDAYIVGTETPLPPATPKSRAKLKSEAVHERWIRALSWRPPIVLTFVFVDARFRFTLDWEDFREWEALVGLLEVVRSEGFDVRVFGEEGEIGMREQVWGCGVEPGCCLEVLCVECGRDNKRVRKWCGWKWKRVFGCVDFGGEQEPESESDIEVGEDSDEESLGMGMDADVDESSEWYGALEKSGWCGSEKEWKAGLWIRVCVVSGPMMFLGCAVVAFLVWSPVCQVQVS